ncbi:hypothetical protein OPKNFCMD_6827 [Methylobacterium crusticola]|uniref:Uncharacterized protein n=1 Tax=Methylobacterium crusticola TaxID=1697972 RepID=A0ABQ4R9G2_9HYPH|nr:hypothetical protein OPKNFCMD_6827 [Methylobacterium crusticola]
MIAAAVPLKVVAASAVPSPAAKVRPVIPASEKVPPVTAIETVRTPLSTSATASALPPAVEKTRAVSSAVTWAPGTATTGASFTGVTITITVAVSVTPPAVTV